MVHHTRRSSILLHINMNCAVKTSNKYIVRLANQVRYDHCKYVYAAKSTNYNRFDFIHSNLKTTD